MAKLTESYLRGMIKQVMNEMYDDSPAALGNAADLYHMGDLDTTIEEIAKELNVDPVKLAAFIEQEQAQADAFDDEMAGYEEDDGMYESRKRKALLGSAKRTPKRK